MKRLINWFLGKPKVTERVELLWMDLQEITEPEIYEMEGYDSKRNYYSGKVYLKDVYERGPYTYEIWTCKDANINFVCDTSSISIFRCEEVLRGIQ